MTVRREDRSSLPSKREPRSAILLIFCPDQPGVVAAVAEFIHENGGNIVDLDEHVDASDDIFYMRVEWSLDSFAIRPHRVGEYFQTLIGSKFNMTWVLHFSDEVPRMAIFVSKLGHCLYDLLSRWQSGEWRAEIPLIVDLRFQAHPCPDAIAVAIGALSVVIDLLIAVSKIAEYLDVLQPGRQSRRGRVVLFNCLPHILLTHRRRRRARRSCRRCALTGLPIGLDRCQLST